MVNLSERERQQLRIADQLEAEQRRFKALLDNEEYAKYLVEVGNRRLSIIDAAIQLRKPFYAGQRSALEIKNALDSAADELGIDQDWVKSQLILLARNGSKEAASLLAPKRFSRS